jgi:hypothetical protein
MRKLLFCTLQLLFLISGAEARSLSEAVEEFRLLGVWAVDCYRVPTPRNGYTTFSKARDGSIRLVNDFGANYEDMVYRIVAIVRIDDERLLVTQVLTTDPHIEVDVIFLKVSGRIRTWSSRMSDGTILVDDGYVDRTSRHRTPWEERCDERRAEPGEPTGSQS